MDSQSHIWSQGYQPREIFLHSIEGNQIKLGPLASTGGLALSALLGCGPPQGSDPPITRVRFQANTVLVERRYLYPTQMCEP